MYNYFKLPNFLFDNYKLSSSELAVAAAMYSIYCNTKNRNHFVRIKQSTLCTLTNIKCEKTVSKAVNRLEGLGIIKYKKRVFKVSTGKLGTYQYVLQPVCNKYTFIERKVFHKSLSVSELRVYLFICKSIDNKRKLCWNSYQDLSNKLSMARSRVIQIVKKLTSKGLLIKYRVLKDNGSYSDNHYITANLNQYVNIKKRKPTDFRPPLAFKNTNKNILVNYNTLTKNICQGQNKKFFMCLQNVSLTIRGSPVFYCSS